MIKNTILDKNDVTLELTGIDTYGQENDEHSIQRTQRDTRDYITSPNPVNDSTPIDDKKQDKVHHFINKLLTATSNPTDPLDSIYTIHHWSNRLERTQELYNDLLYYNLPLGTVCNDPIKPLDNPIFHHQETKYINPTYCKSPCVANDYSWCPNHRKHKHTNRPRSKHKYK